MANPVIRGSELTISRTPPLGRLNQSLMVNNLISHGLYTEASIKTQEDWVQTAFGLVNVWKFKESTVLG